MVVGTLVGLPQRSLATTFFCTTAVMVVGTLVGLPQIIINLPLAFAVCSNGSRNFSRTASTAFVFKSELNIFAVMVVGTLVGLPP